MGRRRFVPHRRARGALLAGVVASTVLVVGATPAGAQDYMLGIDVSHHQGAINWQRVADSGHVYAFHKATEGATFTDDRYAGNRSNAAAADVAFGAYHFARPQGDSIAAAQADAEAEAAHFLAVADPQPGDLLPVLDLEATGSLPDQRLIAWTQRWLDEVNAALDVRPLIYTSPHFWQTNLANTTTFAEQGFPLWIAHYTSAAAPTTPAGNWGGNGWAFWQWTNCATIPGISGCVDEDRYRGSDLSPYVIPGAQEPEPPPDDSTPPSNESPPEISGRAEVGETLTASSGRWGGSTPQSYSYSWHRCDRDGTGCSAVLKGTKPTYRLQNVDFGHRMQVTVTATNSAGSSEADSATSDVVTDTTAPDAPRVTRPRRRQTLKTNLNVAWQRVEEGLRYDVRYRVGGRGGTLGDYRDLALETRATTATLEAATGKTYCFSARAIDEADNRSDWSPERCTAVPLDDRDLRRGSGWAPRTGRRFYLRTFSLARRRGAVLLAPRRAATSVYLVAQRCPDCGRVRVLLNGEPIGAANLRALRTRNKQVIHIADLGSLQRGDFRVVVTSGGASVKIDGLALVI